MDESSASGRMNHYEKGRHTPDIHTLKRIADKLDVPLSYFFCEDDLTAKIICALDKVSDANKSKVLNMLSEMVNNDNSEKN